MVLRFKIHLKLSSSVNSSVQFSVHQHELDILRKKCCAGLIMFKAVQLTLNWATLHLLFSVVTTATVSAVRIMLASGRKPILEKGSTVLSYGQISPKWTNQVSPMILTNYLVNLPLLLV